jgi:hypothetical protein
MAVFEQILLKGTGFSTVAKRIEKHRTNLSSYSLISKKKSQVFLLSVKDCFI